MNRLPFRGVTLIEDARLHLSLIINYTITLNKNFIPVGSSHLFSPARRFENL